MDDYNEEDDSDGDDDGVDDDYDNNYDDDDDSAGQHGVMKTKRMISILKSTAPYSERNIWAKGIFFFFVPFNTHN